MHEPSCIGWWPSSLFVPMSIHLIGMAVFAIVKMIVDIAEVSSVNSSAMYVASSAVYSVIGVFTAFTEGFVVSRLSGSGWLSDSSWHVVCIPLYAVELFTVIFTLGMVIAQSTRKRWTKLFKWVAWLLSVTSVIMPTVVWCNIADGVMTSSYWYYVVPWTVGVGVVSTAIAIDCAERYLRYKRQINLYTRIIRST